jgi:predicted nucleic acid-binding protein
MILVDTNVLVYAVNSDAPKHTSCRALVEAVRAGEVQCALVPQVLLEFHAIVTDGRRVTRPLAPETAQEVVRALRGFFPVLDACREALEYLPVVVVEKGISGGDIFDAWLVAQMRVLGIDRICTYNAKDFMGYTGIRAVRPEEALGVHNPPLAE